MQFEEVELLPGFADLNGEPGINSAFDNIASEHKSYEYKVYLNVGVLT